MSRTFINNHITTQTGRVLVRRYEIEMALNCGQLKVRVNNGNLWQARRNGATKLWKKRPNDFRIPIKFGFKSYAALDQDNILNSDLVICPRELVR